MVVALLMVSLSVYVTADATASLRAILNAELEPLKKQVEMAPGRHAISTDASSLSQVDTTRVTSGYLNILLGTDTACLPVTAVVRVQLGVCYQGGVRVNDDQSTQYFLMNTVQKLANRNAQWVQNIYTDADCAIDAGFSSNPTTFYEGCGTLQLDSVGTGGVILQIFLQAQGVDVPATASQYATVTYDTGFDALPAASLVPASWYVSSFWKTSSACTNQATANPPIFIIATPVAVMAPCPAPTSCTDIGVSSPALLYGESVSQDCVTVTPQATGYNMVTQWTGGDPQQVKKRTEVPRRTRRTPHPRPHLVTNTTHARGLAVPSARAPSPTSRWR